MSGPTGSVDTYALFDDGSTATFVDSEVTDKIGSRGPEKQIHLDCVGGLGKDAKVQYVNFTIRGRHSIETHTITRARSIVGLGAARQRASRDCVQNYQHLADIANEFCYDMTLSP